jgi:uracil-DNA glycosylase family 4
LASCDTFDAACTRCARLDAHLQSLQPRFPDYHNGPVPAFGDAGARLVIVGLAPGLHGANATGRPFTGDHAGILLYRCLHRLGLANRPEATAIGDGLELRNCRITNAVKCLPPENRPTTTEVDTCNAFLRCELLALPRGHVVVALGTVAHRAVLKAHDIRLSSRRFAHGAEHPLPRGLLIDSYHCSRYNTQTGRLTEPMFMQVLERAAELAGG